MNKKNVASLMAVAAVAASIGANATVNKGVEKNHKNNVLLSNNISKNNEKVAVVVNGNDSLVLRSTPDNKSIISYLSVGEMLTIKGRVGNYYEVVVEETGATGYINIKNAEIVESGINDSLEKVNEEGNIINVTNTVRIRQQATMNSKVSALLHNGDKLNIVGKQGQWYEVNYEGKKGFVYFEYINFNNETSSNNSELKKQGINSTTNKIQSTSNNKKLLSTILSTSDVKNYFGNYNVSSILGPSYSYGRENAVIGQSFTMNSKLFLMENVSGAMNYNIDNPSYEIKKQSASDFEKNYGYNPSNIGLTGDTLIELIVAGTNKAENSQYGLNSFGSNNEMIFYIENGKLILFEPTVNSAYICENSTIYNKEIQNFNSLVKAEDNKSYSINTTEYKESNKFNINEANLYNRVFNIVKANLWTVATGNQRTMTMDMGTIYNKDGKAYYSVYLYSINGSERAEVKHYYISPEGSILSGNVFSENTNQSLSYEQRKNIITKIAMEYMSQSTDNNIYSFNCNLNKSIVQNGIRYYQVNAWSSNPIYPGGQVIKESDIIYVSPYGNVINTYNKTIANNSENYAQNLQGIDGINKRIKKG